MIAGLIIGMAAETLETRLGPVHKHMVHDHSGFGNRIGGFRVCIP